MNERHVHERRHAPPELLGANFPSRNNRLARYYVFGPDPDREGGQPRPMLRTVKYVYQITGNLSDIMVKDNYVNSTLTPGPEANYEWVWHLGLYYNLQGQVFRAVWDRWKEPYNQYYHEPKFLRQFVYDGPTELVEVRSFRLTRGNFDVDLASQEVQPVRRFEYAGGQPTGEFNTVALRYGYPSQCIFEYTKTREHLNGLGRFATQTLGAGGEVSYPHGDLVGSTMMRVNAAGQAETTVAYTAFGEPISAGVSGVPNVQGDADWAALGSIDRYCGEWNYQTGSLTASVPDFNDYEYPVADDLVGLRTTNPTLPPIILTHVGYRWYDASIGRFVQRDPIGLQGGKNLYAYVGANPVNRADPLGLVPDTSFCPECGRVYCTTCHGGGGSGIAFDPAAVDAFINQSTNGVPYGTTAAGIGAYTYAKYKWSALPWRWTINAAGACMGGWYLGWNAGKAIDSVTGASRGLGWIIAGAPPARLPPPGPLLDPDLTDPNPMPGFRH